MYFSEGHMVDPIMLMLYQSDVSIFNSGLEALYRALTTIFFAWFCRESSLDSQKYYIATGSDTKICT